LLCHGKFCKSVSIESILLQSVNNLLGISGSKFEEVYKSFWVAIVFDPYFIEGLHSVWHSGVSFFFDVSDGSIFSNDWVFFCHEAQFFFEFFCDSDCDCVFFCDFFFVFVVCV